jgi:hypothetical protein
MKPISELAVLLLAATITATAQPPRVGFVRMVNAVAPGEGTSRIRINGEDIFPKGYELGQMTGGMGLRQGPHTISFERKGVESGNTGIALDAGETVTLIGFAEKQEAKQDEPEKPAWKTRILRLRQKSPEKGYHLTFVSVCDLEDVVVNAGSPGSRKPEFVRVRRLTTSSLNIGGRRNEVLVRDRERMLLTVSPDHPGNYVIVLYQDAQCTLRALSFYDPKFVIAG